MEQERCLSTADAPDAPCAEAHVTVRSDPLIPLIPLIGGIMVTALAAAPTFFNGTGFNGTGFHGPGAGFPFFFLVPLVWVVVVIGALALLARGARRRWATYGGPASGPHRSPEATLSERFANGEIDEVEYRSRLEVLRANRPAKR